MSANPGISRRHVLGMAVAVGGLAMSSGVRSMLAQAFMQTPGQILRWQAPSAPPPVAPSPGYMEAAQALLAEPFKGITTDGTSVPGLFSIQRTGISTTPIKDAVAVFVAAPSPQRQVQILFSVDSDEWRRWSSMHRYPRQGVSVAEMSLIQRGKVFALLKKGLSLKRGLLCLACNGP